MKSSAQKYFTQSTNVKYTLVKSTNNWVKCQKGLLNTNSFKTEKKTFKKINLNINTRTYVFLNENIGAAKTEGKQADSKSTTKILAKASAGKEKNTNLRTQA